METSRRDLIALAGVGAMLAGHASAANVAGPLARRFKLGSWSPWQLTPSVLKAWWAADDLASGTIQNWPDRIGGLVMTQGTSAQRPTRSATSFNSAYPGVTFDGVMTSLAITSLGNIPVGAVAGEIWCVATNTSIVSTIGIPAVVGTGAAASRRLQASTAGTNGVASANDGTSAVNSLVPWTTPLIVKGDWSGTSMNGYVNGSPFPLNPMTIATLNTNSTRARLGAGSGAAPANFWPGPLRHVVVIQGVLSTVLRQKMEGWLAWDSGLQASLPATHPYQLFHP